MEILTQPKKQSYYLIALFLILIILVLFWWNKTISKSKSPKVSENNDAKIEVTQMKPLPKGVMKLASDKTNYSIGEKIIVTVSADSAGEKVVAFDANISKSDKFKFVSVKSLLPDFITFRATDNYIIGSQNLESTKETILKNQPIAEVVFEALQEGSEKIVLEFEPFSTKDSSLQNGQTNPQDILGSVEGASISISKNTNSKNR